MVRASIFLGLLVAPAVLLAGCQGCVADSAQPDPAAQAPAEPGGSFRRFRPRPMNPMGRLLLRDAGAGDE